MRTQRSEARGAAVPGLGLCLGARGPWPLCPHWRTGARPRQGHPHRPAGSGQGRGGGRPCLGSREALGALTIFPPSLSSNPGRCSVGGGQRRGLQDRSGGSAPCEQRWEGRTTPGCSSSTPGPGAHAGRPAVRPPTPWSQPPSPVPATELAQEGGGCAQAQGRPRGAGSRPWPWSCAPTPLRRAVRAGGGCGDTGPRLLLLGI